MDYYDLQQITVAVATASVIYALYRRSNRPSVRDIPGPPNPSWVHGHQWYWQNQESSAVEKHILENYGTVARWNGPLGEERLWIADPKAINHIFKNSNLYGKLSSMREVIALLLDRGLIWADGDAHRRQRKAMSPAFGVVEVQGLLPYFAQSATKLADKWHELIEGPTSGESSVIDILPWLSKATLDAIGMGAFEYEFGALDGSSNLLAKTYLNLLDETFGNLPKGRVFFRNVARWFPNGLLTWFFERNQSPGVVKLRQNRDEAHHVARALINAKRGELKTGTSGKDLMSSLVKASSALRPELRLNDDEIAAQVRTIMFAGHDTTAKTLTFALWELAKNRDVQDKLRAEVNEAWGKVKARGDSGFIANDFDSMPYLIAVGKETLRIHSAVIEVSRVVWNDDVIPLSKPVVGNSGKVYDELLIPGGTSVVVSTYGHNLNPAVWGADSFEWRPGRWLEANGDPESPIGVYGNLATFSGGVRSCIGWRFAAIEMHMFLVTLVKQFEFTLPDNAPKIGSRRPTSSIIPVVEGEEHKGNQLPLKISLLENE